MRFLVIKTNSIEHYRNFNSSNQVKWFDQNFQTGIQDLNYLYRNCCKVVHRSEFPSSSKEKLDRQSFFVLALTPLLKKNVEMHKLTLQSPFSIQSYLAQSRHGVGMGRVGTASKKGPVIVDFQGEALTSLRRGWVCEEKG